MYTDKFTLATTAMISARLMQLWDSWVVRPWASGYYDTAEDVVDTIRAKAEYVGPKWPCTYDELEDPTIQDILGMTDEYMSEDELAAWQHAWASIVAATAKVWLG